MEDVRWKTAGCEGARDRRERSQSETRLRPISGSLESVCLIVMNFL